MTRTRRIAAALALIMLSLPAGCSGGNLNAPEKKFVIDVVVKKIDADFWKVVQMGAEAAGKEFDVTVNYMGTTDETKITGDDGQIKMMQDAIDSRPDAIVLAANDYIQLVDVVEKAVAANIPIIIIDSDVKSDKTRCFIGTDNVGAGRTLGQSLVNKVGPDCKITVMGFVKGAATNDQREQGLMEVIKDNGGINVLSIIYCNSDTDYARRRTMEVVQKHPDIDAIVCLNAYGTEGAAMALSEMEDPGKVKIIGFDSTQEEIRFMEKGVIQSLVVQNPYSMGYLGVKYALDAIHGKTLPRQKDTGASVIDRDNMYLPENQKLLFPFTS